MGDEKVEITFYYSFMKLGLKRERLGQWCLDRT